MKGLKARKIIAQGKAGLRATPWVNRPRNSQALKGRQNLDWLVDDQDMTLRSAVSKRRCPCAGKPAPRYSARAVRLPCPLLALSLWLLCVLPALPADLVPVEPLGLRVARGFRVTQYADADLANDIYAMTLDSRGNVVVTGQGYIKTLFDRDGDGRADTATLFAPTQTGGMGMCFDGNDLYFCGDGFFSRYRDADGDGQADGAPERFLPLAFAEHGGHAMRKGPDGWWYLIAGNETRFTGAHITLPNSPVRQIEAGALLRVTPDGQRSEAIAHGFRNPYDFDFNWLGDIFTYDSDMEADFFLPWYSPTRLYHIGYGGHHGWRLEGWGRSWARPDYYADTVDILYSIGRGSPTGVTCYRHFQFPPRFRNGFFALDWTFGKVYFMPLQQSGASYQGTPEVFLQSTGTHGFDPTDIVVTPDGSLLISIGGRRTRGAIYRVQYVAEGDKAASAGAWQSRATSDLDGVLNAPQPLDAWARAIWVPVARQLGALRFAEVVADNRIAPEMRVRAVEIMTELHGGLDPATAAAGAQANSPSVRGRVAWSLGRIPAENFVPILSALVRDIDSFVRRCALDAMADHAHSLDNITLQQALAANLAHPEKRIRQCAARLAASLPDLAWNALWKQQAKGLPQARLTLALALLWRSAHDAINVPAIDSALSVLAQSTAPSHRLAAIRLIILALGDYHLRNPSMEVYTGFEPALSLAGQEALVRRIRAAIRPLAPSGDFLVDAEAWRLLAMLEDDDMESTRKLLSSFTERSFPGDDFHSLTVLSRLKATLPTNSLPKLAHTILSLDRKLEGQETRGKQNWSPRLAEVVQALLQREPKLAGALLRDPVLVSPNHLAIAASLFKDRPAAVAAPFAAAVRANPKFPWSGPLIDLLSALPAEDVHPLFRRQWANLVLRDDILIQLAQKPMAVDRDKFITGLSSLQPKVVRSSLAALLMLPQPLVGQASRLPPGRPARESKDRGETPAPLLARPAGNSLVPALRLLRRLESEPKEREARTDLVAFLNLETGRPFKIEELSTDPANLKRAYQPIFDWFSQQYPGLVVLLDAEGTEDAAQWNALLKRVAWDKGDPLQGQTIFNERGCQICHASSTPLGPDLGGVTSRFSLPDVFNAIIYPSRDVAPAYRTTAFQTRDGQTYTGIVAFESAEGVILQTGATTTVRLAESDIVSRQPSALSLMPSGLLSGLKPADLADLYSYLKTLRPKGQ